MRISLILSLCGLMLTASCGSHTQTADTPQPAPEVAHIVSKITIVRDRVLVLLTPSDSSQSYTIYYPGSATTPDSTPIMVCFDPHGDGSLPIDKYRKLADKFGVAIAVSNSSKNGLNQQDVLLIANNMIADINERLGFNKKNMALCGFSGGAKVAILAASADAEISKLIYAGAVTPMSTTRPISLLGFAGEQDMNYSDLLQFDESEKSKNPNSALVEFSGKHEWPDASVFNKAFYFLAIRSGHIDSNYINKNVADFINSTRLTNTKSESLSATYQQCSFAVFLLSGICNVSGYRELMKNTEQIAEFQKSILNKKESITYEANQKSILIQSFQDKDLNWWTKVIKSYNTSTKLSDKRLLGFISLACYSYSSQLLSQQNIEGADKILSIYELSDPLNTDQLYLHAILYAQKKDNKVSLKYLQKAVSNGFDQAEKIQSERSFIPLKSDPNFVQIVASAKKHAR